MISFVSKLWEAGLFSLAITGEWDEKRDASNSGFWGLDLYVMKVRERFIYMFSTYL
jgi:hypothetical protein